MIHLPGSFLDAFQAFAQSAAPAAVTSLWQGIAVAAALGLGLRLAPRIAAAHRFLVWFAGFAFVAALPFLPAATALVAHPAAQVASPTPSAAWFELGPHWMQAIAIFWLVASLYRAIDLAIHTLRLRKLWRTATPVEAGDIAIRNVQVCVQSCVQVCTTAHLDRPSVIGFFAPRILIPAWLFARLTPAELQQIILHESQHLSRRDDWTNLLQKLCLVVFPLNPALLWIDRRLAREREMACDEAVVRITRAPRAYAACLASLAERGLARRTEALSLGAFERRPELVRRVHSILRSRRALHPAAARAIFAGLACGVGMLSFELARCPQLVAFDSPAKPAQIAQSDLADAVYTPRPRISSQFRAIPAKAVMPIPVTRALTHHQTARRHTQPEAPGAQQLAATAHPLALHSQAQQSQQWIVFTEWEQVETTQPAAGTETRATAQQPTADYDTAPAAGNADTATRDTAKTAPPIQQPPSTQQPSSRIRVTQLVLRVLPPASRPHQPAAIPLGNGWFVFQL